jgi:hypothetical protein
MRFLRYCLGLGLALVLGASACAPDERERATTGTGPTNDPKQASIRFEEDGTLALAPGAAEEIRVAASPPAPYSVRFTILGDAIDGWLDAADVEAGADGRASARLHAPTEPTTFRVRAAILDEAGAPGSSAEIGVAVSDQGFGTIRVVPSYKGKRAIDGWTASLVARTTCADLAPSLPGEPPGALVASADGAEGRPVIEDAPVGPSLAVAVRAGHYAFGCVNVVDLAPDEERDVTIPVTDKFIDLEAGSLHAVLLYDPDPGPYAELLAGAAAGLGDAFMPKGANQGAVLLNEMQALAAPGDAMAFVAARLDQGWDSIASKHLALLGVDLRVEVELWAGVGLAVHATSIEADLGPGASAPQASFVVTSFAGYDPSAAGVAASPSFTWTGQADDTVTLSGVIVWEPSRLAGAAALVGAEVAVPGAADVPEALAEVADCQGLAAKLGAFGACGVACAADLCRSALASRWADALDASLDAGKLGQVSIQASTHAVVGDVAEPVSLDGHWLGKITAEAIGASVVGDMKASPSAPPPN